MCIRDSDRSFERVEMETGVRKFLNSFLYFGLYAVLLFVIAGQIGIDSASIVAILGSAGLALGPVSYTHLQAMVTVRIL